MTVGLILGLALAPGAALAQQDEASADSAPGTDERAALLERWEELVDQRRELWQELAQLNQELAATARELWPERFERGPRAFREQPRMSFRSFGPRAHRRFPPGAAPWHRELPCPTEEPQDG